MEEIVIASNNKDKIREAQEILDCFKIVSMKDIGINIDIKEDGKTFEENAIKKAEIISKFTKGKKCIADDSGIEIEYLNGFPGVLTKRWFKGSDKERNLELLEKLKNVPIQKRKIKFICAIALSDGKNTVCETGILNGFVAEKLKGKNGFGFDELFELENGKTLAELSHDEKNKISARKIALEKTKKYLLQNINSDSRGKEWI